MPHVTLLDGPLAGTVVDVAPPWPRTTLTLAAPDGYAIYHVDGATATFSSMLAERGELEP